MTQSRFPFSYLLRSADEPDAEQKTCVTIDEWIDVWGTLVGKAKKLDDFPMWLQYYPKVLFDVINRTGGEMQCGSRSQ